MGDRINKKEITDKTFLRVGCEFGTKLGTCPSVSEPLQDSSKVSGILPSASLVIEGALCFKYEWFVYLGYTAWIEHDWW